MSKRKNDSFEVDLSPSKKWIKDVTSIGRTGARAKRRVTYSTSFLDPLDSIKHIKLNGKASSCNTILNPSQCEEKINHVGYNASNTGRREDDKVEEDTMHSSADAAGVGKNDLEEMRKNVVTKDDAEKTGFPMRDFDNHKDEFLNEFIRHEGPIGVGSNCNECGMGGRIYRCRKCFMLSPRCEKCIVKAHLHSPLHFIEGFNGFSWERNTLMNLGLIINFGHHDDVCPAHSSVRIPVRPTIVTVLDTDGIQRVAVRFCNCRQRVGVQWEERNQLLKARWFPASIRTPRTVATFGCLEQFEAVTQQGKLSGYDYYKSLVGMSDNAGTIVIKRRYEEFMLMARAYQHIKLLQRAGVSLTNGSAKSVAEGQLAVECPACPHPERNLPEKWEEDGNAWLYTQFIMIDANFKLKQKKKRIKNDIELAPGLAYFVEDSRYKEHLAGRVNEKEMKYCSSGLRAVNLANIKGGRGYDATGVVAVQCRHMLIRKNGVGDLQKGERFCNVDYVVLSSLKGSQQKRLTMSYDIACQYHRNLHTRNAQFPDDLKLALDEIEVNYVIPNFHIYGHGESCQSKYSMNFLQYMARTDGENIERGWAAFNPASMQTKEMGSGSRRDVLNFHFSYWNWMRIVLMGIILYNRLREAMKESKRHKEAHDRFCNGFSGQELREMKRAVLDFYQDPFGSEDPFREKRHSAVLKHEETKYLYTKAKKSSQNKAESTDISEVMTAKIWLLMGIQIEEDQRVVKKLYDELGLDSSNARHTAAEELNFEVLSKLKYWQSYQKSFMPGLSEVETIEGFYDEDEVICAWDVIVLLPSKVAVDIRDKVSVPGLYATELELRENMADEYLDQIKKYLLRERLLKLKKRSQVGYGQNEQKKARLAIANTEKKMRKSVEEYRETFKILQATNPDGDWRKRLNFLADEDLIAPLRDKSNKKETERGRTQSWIWGSSELLIDDEDESDERLHEGLRVEWAKSKARVDRWKEEEMLVKEEMRRVLTYLNWKYAWWLIEGKKFVSGLSEIDKGKMAYANKQASILKNMATQFREKWAPLTDNYLLPSFQTSDLLPVTL